MANLMNAAAQQRLSEYFDCIGAVLGRKGRRASFALYAEGVLGDGERKSVEPIAARACADPARADAVHQRLLHFMVDSRWSDRDVRREAARYALAAITAREPVEVWIVDDTGFLKQGTHSVGVQRQYTGSAGKIANCQIGVSLSIATPQDHVAVDFELYLPASWPRYSTPRTEARIPPEIGFQTKSQLALSMLRRAVAADLPRGTVLADETYGNAEFREGCRRLGLDFAVAISATTQAWVVDAAGRRHGNALPARELAARLAEQGALNPQDRFCYWLST